MSDRAKPCQKVPKGAKAGIVNDGAAETSPSAIRLGRLDEMKMRNVKERSKGHYDHSGDPGEPIGFFSRSGTDFIVNSG